MNRPDIHLLKLLIITEEQNKESDKLISFNGNFANVKGIENWRQDEIERFQEDPGSTLSLFHRQMINDVAWAPLAARSFHFIASCSKDRTVIIWRVVIKDIMQGFDGELLDHPQIIPV